MVDRTQLTEEQRKLLSGADAYSGGSDPGLAVPGESFIPAPQGAVGEVDARIGELEFHDEFSDPDVEVHHTRETADHDIVTGHDAYRDRDIAFVVQALGRRPSELTITGWVTEGQLSTVDGLVSEDMVEVVTARWTGTAVPHDVDVPYSRVWHDVRGWIFEVTIELFGINQGALPGDPDSLHVTGGGGGGGSGMVNFQR